MAVQGVMYLKKTVTGCLQRSHFVTGGRIEPATSFPVYDFASGYRLVGRHQIGRYGQM
jgi:hypothetical protein